MANTSKKLVTFYKSFLTSSKQLGTITDLHLGDEHLLNHCYIYIYIYAFGIYAAVDFSYDMTYSGTGTKLHLAEQV